MAITDADQLAEVQWRVLEVSSSFPSGLWSVSEIADYFNQRQNRFNRDTKLLLAHQPIATVNGTYSYPLPQDWIATQRMTFTPYNAQGAPSGATNPMKRSDRFAANRGIALGGGTPPGGPVVYDDVSAGTLTLEVFPTPTTAGSIDLLYACTLEALGFGNPPDIFDIPDDFVPFITYGVLADMLSKDGRGQDLARAEYCEGRFEEGVALAAILLEGFA